MPLGHADEHAVEALLRSVRRGEFDGPRLLEHFGKGEPESLLDLARLECEGLVIRQVESMGRHDKRRARSWVASDVVESSEILRLRKFDSDLFVGLAPSGRRRRIILRLESPAGKGHMSGPGVSFALSAFDQQDLDGTPALTKDDGDRGMRLVGRM